MTMRPRPWSIAVGSEVPLWLESTCGSCCRARVERRMDRIKKDALEEGIRTHWQTGDKKRAATALLEAYGHELFGFLVTCLRDRDAAAEVFSQFTEDLWRGFDGFRWHCSARVWSYTLVRHAMSHYIKDLRRRHGQVSLSQAGPLSEIEQKIRTATLTADRSEARSRLAQLRDTLPADDQTLLILRVSRRLGWREIARVMFHDGEPVSDAVLEADAARLRKRYQLAKEKLRRLAQEQGLVPPELDAAPRR
jgi:RNA polymerase sigma-70 factor, ECF subfamily